MFSIISLPVQFSKVDNCDANRALQRDPLTDDESLRMNRYINLQLLYFTLR